MLKVDAGFVLLKVPSNEVQVWLFAGVRFWRSPNEGCRDPEGVKGVSELWWAVMIT